MNRAARNQGASSRKQIKDTRQSRGRKALEEAEKQMTGAGWTLAATNHFLELQTDEERIAHTRAMLSISEEDYNYKIRSTYQVDFHFGNGTFCVEKKFDATQTQFLCKTMGLMLESVMSAAQQEQDPNFDQFRDQLFDDFQNAFFEFNSEEYKFSTDQTKELLKYISEVIIRPLRLIYGTYKQDPYTLCEREIRKVFAPPTPDPLWECVEQFPLPAPEEEFEPPVVKGLNLADVKEAIEQYTQSIIATIDQRYNKMEELVAKMSQANSE